MPVAALSVRLELASCPRFLMAGVSVICYRFFDCSGVIAPACVARILAALLMYGHKKKAPPQLVRCARLTLKYFLSE